MVKFMNPNLPKKKKKIIKEYEDTLDLLLDDYEKDIKKITTATHVFYGLH